MHAVLICPDRQEAVAALGAAQPLACAPAMGESPLEYWLEHLALQGTTHVRILASDRPEAIQALVGEGTRWGLRVDVEAVGEEPTVEAARTGYGTDVGIVARVDTFPGLPDLPLFSSYAAWFAALTAWIPRARTPSRVGVREIAPGVWAGRNTYVAPTARLAGPAWIGAQVRIGADAVIGPNSVIEDRCWVDRGAMVIGSAVGSDTFVGGLCEVADSLAWGATVVNWRDGTVLEVQDPYLLCRLGEPPQSEAVPSAWMLRLPWTSPQPAARPASVGVVPVTPQ